MFVDVNYRNYKQTSALLQDLRGCVGDKDGQSNHLLNIWDLSFAFRTQFTRYTNRK